MKINKIKLKISGGVNIEITIKKKNKTTFYIELKNLMKKYLNI